MALLPPHFLDAVVAIGQKTASGKSEWVATGFHYGIEQAQKTAEGNKLYSLYLVTNRHVVSHLTQGTALVRCNPLASGKAQEVDLNITMSDGSSAWRVHPSAEVDVAVTPVNPKYLEKYGLQTAFYKNTDDAATTNKMLTLGTSEGDFAYVLGFPMGRVGGEQNSVIVRSGSIARIRETLTRPRERFTVDSFVFPGNSGGPVILKPEPTAIAGTRPLDRALVIGVVAGYVPYQDVALSLQTQRPRVIFEENSGLAEAHTMDAVDEAIASGVSP